MAPTTILSRRPQPEPEPHAGPSGRSAGGDLLALVDGMRARDPEAMERFLAAPIMARARRVLGALFGGAGSAGERAEVDDAVQEGCLKLWAAAETFEGRTAAQCERWVLCIFANAARDLRRRSRRSSEVECVATAWTGRPEPELDAGAAAIEVEDARLRLKELLTGRLRGRERRLLLADLDLERGYGDTVLALNLATTKQNLRTIRCRVRKKLSADRQVDSLCRKLTVGPPPPAGGGAVIA